MLRNSNKQLPFNINSLLKQNAWDFQIIREFMFNFVLFLLVFFKHAMRSAMQTPESAEKIQRLKLAWGKAIGRKNLPSHLYHQIQR